MRTKSIFNLTSLVFTVCAGVLLSTTSAWAQEQMRFYSGARMMGMGGAYTGVTDDETSVLNDPAGLGKIRDATWTIIDPELEGSSTDTQIATASTATDVIDLQKLDGLLKQNPGILWHAKAQVFPSIVATNFGFGVYGNYVYDGQTDATGTNLTLFYRNDFAAALGYCFRLFNGIVKIGVSGRAVDRTEIDNVTVPTSSTNVSVQGLAGEGLGVASDVAVIMTAPVVWLPTLAGVVHDVGNTSYALSNGMFNSLSTRPPDSIQTIDAGIALFPILANNTRMSIAADFDDLTNVEKTTDSMVRVHAGLEFNFNDFLFVRGGMNQRYWTAGIELDAPHFQLQATSFGEEIGTATAPKEDRRYIAKLSIRL